MKEYPTPEPKEVIAAQIRAFLDGRKPAVLITHGNTVPDVYAKKAEIPEGVLIYHDPLVLKMAQSGKLGTALGYGIDAKPVTDRCLTVRDETGQVIHDVMTDGRESVERAGRHVAGDNGSIEYRGIDAAMMERHGVSTMEELEQTMKSFYESEMQRWQQTS